MPSIFPEDHAGGVAIRDGAGAPTNPVNVERAYPPAPAFISNCPITALPSDCTARIEPVQINAIVSELVSFAECLDPDGPWDCSSLQNLCNAFTVWADNVIVEPVPVAVLVQAPELVGTGLAGAPITFTGITTGPSTGAAAGPSGFRGVGLSTDPLVLEVIDGGTY